MKSFSTQTIDALLNRFESNRMDFLDKVAKDYPAQPALLAHLVKRARNSDDTVQIAATALLKRYQAAGAFFSVELVTELLDLLPALTVWQSRLHLLQIIPGLQIPANHAEALCDCLHKLAKDRNRFVRAWTYASLHRLASLYPDYRDDVRSLLRKASRDESASVRARLRQLRPLPK